MTSEKTAEIFQLLKKKYPHAKIILHFDNPWELLVAVILSAQCTDVMVNKVTKTLFPKYLAKRDHAPHDKSKIKNITPDVQEIINYAEVPIAELEQDIKSTGFYRNKAKSVQGAAKTVLKQFDGTVPKTMKEMLTIPGVGRKTANVVLGNAYGVVEGIAVDTHVKRQAVRLGLSRNTTPEKIEQDLMKLFPKKDWFTLTYLLIEHGRAMRFQKDKDYEKRILGSLAPK